MSRWQRTMRGRTIVLAAAALLAGVATTVVVAAGNATSEGARPTCEKTASNRVPQPTPAQLAAAGLGQLPIAARKQRVDLVAPAFSNPTKVTNPLFPISRLHSAILNGRVDGKPFRVETTLLPNTRIVEWTDGQCVETLVSQYVAYLDGRIEEVALDLYAQADDGSVWYFGEDVFNYKAGAIADTGGTWLAGKQGPAAMIMPGNPKIGDVFRPENIAGLVFEEVDVKATGKSVDGPRGRVPGVIVTGELHQDGTREDKAFAPGYGEFHTGSGDNVEALALAVPTDAVSGPPPTELVALSSGADAIFGAAQAADWNRASATREKLDSSWARYRRTGSVLRLEEPTTRALKVLAVSVEGRNRAAARHAALDVVQAALDLELQYRPVHKIDLARFDLWLRQVIVDAQDRNLTAVNGDIATLEWIRDRIAHKLGKVDVTRIDTGLRELRGNVGDEDLKAASTTASRLRKIIARLG